MLLLFGGYQRATDQSKYSRIITKPANLQDYDYLEEAPPRGSSLIFMLKKQTLTVNSISISEILVDVRYNGLLLNYCDNVSGSGCTWEQFQAKVRRLIYSEKEFKDHCDGSTEISHKIALITMMLLLVVCMVHRCIKSVMAEKLKSEATANLIKRGIITPDGELEVSAGVGLELGVNVDVDLEVSAPVDQGAIQMDETLDDIDAGVTMEIDVGAPMFESQVEPDAAPVFESLVEVDVEPVVEVELEIEVDANPLEANVDLEVGLTSE